MFYNLYALVHLLLVEVALSATNHLSKPYPRQFIAVHHVIQNTSYET